MKNQIQARERAIQMVENEMNADDVSDADRARLQAEADSLRNQTHTPGPFKNNGLYIQQASSGRILATIKEDGSRRNDVIGNLALFTASPDLLAACEWALPLVVEWFNQKPHCQDHTGLTALREAIAAAKGEA